MFTLFSVFGERLPGQVRKDMVEWIESNLEVFKSKVFMAMAVLDMYFDSWLDQVKSNETIGDGFCLNTLCQMSQHHALVVTVEKIWMTIPPNFLKTDDEICRLYDIHLLYMCWDTYAVLKLVFEWKCEVPLGEVSLITPDPSEPLGVITDVQIERDQNQENIVEVKQETEEPIVQNVQDKLGLINIPPLPETGCVLLDATRNLLVELPDNISAPMDATTGVPTIDEEGQPMDATIEDIPKNADDEPDDTNMEISSQIEKPQNLATSIPCSIVLKDVSKELKGKESVKLSKPSKEMCRATVCLERLTNVNFTF